VDIVQQTEIVVTLKLQDLTALVIFDKPALNSVASNPRRVANAAIAAITGFVGHGGAQVSLVTVSTPKIGEFLGLSCSELVLLEEQHVKVQGNNKLNDDHHHSRGPLQIEGPNLDGGLGRGFPGGPLRPITVETTLGWAGVGGTALRISNSCGVGTTKFVGHKISEIRLVKVLVHQCDLRNHINGVKITATLTTSKRSGEVKTWVHERETAN
jgi:hypothetical protein